MTPPGVPEADVPTPMTTMSPEMAIPPQHGLGNARMATTPRHGVPDLCRITEDQAGEEEATGVRRGPEGLGIVSVPEDLTGTGIDGEEARVLDGGVVRVSGHAHRTTGYVADCDQGHCSR